jgi:hypothetical protein
VDAIFSITGGARIGLVNATWPFAKLAVSPSLLRLSSLQGTYNFAPSDVVSLQSCGSIPIFSRGIRITHARQDYPAKIIFWYLGNPDSVITRIRETGFLPSAPASAEIRWRGIPIRWTALVVLILTWYGLFLPMKAFAKPPLALGLVPLLGAFSVCWAITKYPQLQKAILRNGRSVSEIKAFLSLIQTVSGLLIITFGIISIVQAFR